MSHPLAENAIRRIDKLIWLLQKVKAPRHAIDELQQLRHEVFDLGEEVLDMERLNKYYEQYTLPAPDDESESDI